MENRRREYTAADLGIEVIFFFVWGRADKDVRLLDRYGLMAAAQLAALRYPNRKSVALSGLGVSSALVGRDDLRLPWHSQLDLVVACGVGAGFSSVYGQ